MPYMYDTFECTILSLDASVISYHTNQCSFATDVSAANDSQIYVTMMQSTVHKSENENVIT